MLAVGYFFARASVEVLSGGSRNLRSGILVGCPQDDSLGRDATRREELWVRLSRIFQLVELF